MFRNIWITTEDLKKMRKPFKSMFVRMAFRAVYIPMYLITFSSILVIAFLTRKNPNEILNMLSQRFFGEDII